MTFNNQAGMTLVEVMLACSLSLFLLLGLTQIYMAIKKTQIRQDAVLEVTENARFAEQLLVQDIRMAGYAGCEQGEPVNQAQAIKGYQDNLPDFLQGKVKKDTDSLIIGRCRKNDGQIKFGQYAYFIGATSRKNQLGQTVYALYGQPIAGAKEELVANITSMKILYGLAKEGSQDIEKYVSANQITAWETVRAVDLALLASSEQPVYITAESYPFRQNLMPADRYLHREWEFYVALRER